MILSDPEPRFQGHDIKFQNEIQFSSNSIMKQLKHRDSDSF